MKVTHHQKEAEELINCRSTRVYDLASEIKRLAKQLDTEIEENLRLRGLLQQAYDFLVADIPFAKGSPMDHEINEALMDLYAVFNRFELELSPICVRDCATSGPNDEAVAYWTGAYKKRLSHISDTDLVEELLEYGAWDADDLADRKSNEERILWIAAWNIREDQDNEV